MAFKASFKFSDSREFDVLTWRVKFNRDVDPKGRPASDIYGGTIYVEVESTPDTIVLDKMFKQYQPVNGNIVFKKADEDAKMKELLQPGESHLAPLIRLRETDLIPDIP